jgi:AcrR family transcriptional regulator
VTSTVSSGREAQRRRTRRAIVDATMALLGRGVDPSINDIAAEADVSRRTVYLYFPSLDQLLLDATLGLMNVDVESALATVRSEDPRERLKVLVRELYASMEKSLPLGRKLIKLTVDGPAPAPGQPRRGYRRVRWLEWAIEPIRPSLARRQFEDLVSSLALVIGWESFIVLIDVRGLAPESARRLTLRTALALLDAAEAAG